MEDTFQIFISYARPDRETATELYAWLEQQGFSPWIDCKKIKGGQNWDFEIKRALDKSNIVILLWSENSQDRRGYIQRELKISLDKLQEKLIDDIFIIPVILRDNISIPEQLKNIHCLYAEHPTFRQDLADAVTHQMERLGGERKKIQKNLDVYWQPTILKEEWDGIPGYAVEIQVLDFSSDTYKNVGQVSQLVRGDLLGALLASRGAKLEQDSTMYNYAQDSWQRTNTFDAHCGDPIFSGRILTLNYAVTGYGAGAAHPVHSHRTFAFLLDPLIHITFLESVFSDPSDAFLAIQKEARKQLLSNSDLELSEDSVFPGTENWNDFRAFVFNEDALDIYFSSYQVGPYSIGTPHVSVSYGLIAKDMRAEFATALNIPWHMRS
ncbi:TIR domain-containing protein [Ensifer sp. LBL]|uniref:TIR domain-containing protein n=1 Tax=Ensifer sp. LBL TaxID=2991056 RepID=UPI003D19C5D7